MPEATPACDDRHAGHRRVRDRRVHHAAADAEHRVANASAGQGRGARSAGTAGRRPRPAPAPAMSSGIRGAAAGHDPAGHRRARAPSIIGHRQQVQARRCNADRPRTSCRYSVVRKRKPPMAAIALTAISAAPANGDAAEEPQVEHAARRGAALVGDEAPRARRADSANKRHDLRRAPAQRRALDDRVGERAEHDDDEHLADRVRRGAAAAPATPARTARSARSRPGRPGCSPRRCPASRPASTSSAADDRARAPWTGRTRHPTRRSPGPARSGR